MPKLFASFGPRTLLFYILLIVLSSHININSAIRILIIFAANHISGNRRGTSASQSGVIIYVVLSVDLSA